MTAVNGHPTPSPITEQRKVEPTRVLVVELRHGDDVVVGTEEPSVLDVALWLRENEQPTIGELKRREMVEKRPGVMGGKACVAGTRINVSMLEGMRRRGVAVEWVLRNYPHITYEQLEAAWKYADVNRLEIDADLADDEEGDVDSRDTEPPAPTEVENEAPELGQPGNPERDARLVYRDVNGECARLGAMLDQAQEELLGTHCVTQAEARLGSALALTVEAVRVICERLGRVP